MLRETSEDRGLRREARQVARRPDAASNGVGCLEHLGRCGSQGKNQNARYWNALGSAREVGAALEVARAFRYVKKIDPKLLDNLDRIRATLYRVVTRR